MRPLVEKGIFAQMAEGSSGVACSAPPRPAHEDKKSPPMETLNHNNTDPKTIICQKSVAEASLTLKVMGERTH